MFICNNCKLEVTETNNELFTSEEIKEKYPEIWDVWGIGRGAPLKHYSGCVIGFCPHCKEHQVIVEWID